MENRALAGLPDFRLSGLEGVGGFQGFGDLRVQGSKDLQFLRFGRCHLC